MFNISAFLPLATCWSREFGSQSVSHTFQASNFLFIAPIKALNFIFFASSFFSKFSDCLPISISSCWSVWFWCLHFRVPLSTSSLFPIFRQGCLRILKMFVEYSKEGRSKYLLLFEKKLVNSMYSKGCWTYICFTGDDVLDCQTIYTINYK